MIITVDGSGGVGKGAAVGAPSSVTSFTYIPAEYPVARSDLMTMVPSLAVMVWSEAELEVDPYARVKAYVAKSHEPNPSTLASSI